METCGFLLRFHWILFLRFKLTIFQDWFRWWLGTDQATSHYLNQWWSDYQRIFASFGLNELTKIFPFPFLNIYLNVLTHWGRVTHICVSKLTIIGSDNGLSPGWHQAIIRTNTELLLIGSLGTNYSEILIKICSFSIKKMHLKLSSEFGGHFVSASMC